MKMMSLKMYAYKRQLIKFYRMTWYIDTCTITVMGLLLYRLTLWPKRFKFYCLALDLIILCERRFMYGCVIITALLVAWAT
jgi:hypothetical protein